MQDIKQPLSEAANGLNGEYQLLTSSQVGIVLYLCDGTCQAWNEAFQEILGLTGKQLVGLNSVDLVSRAICEDGSILKNECYPATVAFKTLKPCKEVIGFYKSDGELIWLMVSAQPLFTVGNDLAYAVVTTFTDITASKQNIHHQANAVLNNWSITSLLTVSQDITELHRVEAELQKSQENSRLIADTAPILLWLTDASGLCKFVNQRWLDFTGRTFEQELGYGWTESIHSEDLQYCLDTYSSAFAEHKSFEIEYRLLKASGEYRWMLDKGTPLMAPDNTFTGYIGSCMDITNQKQCEQALQRQLIELEAIYAKAPGGLSVVDTNLRFIRINEHLAQINGLPVSKHIGCTIREALPELADIVEPIYKQIIQSKQPIINYEVHGTTPAQPGVERYWLANYYPLLDKDNNVLAVNAMVEEITERKRIEEERSKALERESNARKIAEAANRVKDEFLAVVSHELRTPLSPIVGWVKILLSQNLNEAKTKQALQTILRNAELQVRLIDDLLDVSRILNGKLSLKVAALDLKTVIEAALETVQLSADSKSIQLSKSLQLITCEMIGDASRLQQVVWNLLSNAIKFTPVGGKVEISLNIIGNDVQIVVCDTGKGINPEFLPYVFESFRQADSSISRKYGGLGLGLAIVRHLVESHGGTVKAESLGEEQGATFTVTLPLVQ